MNEIEGGQEEFQKINETVGKYPEQELFFLTNCGRTFESWTRVV
ncbi:hypothetical protein [Wolbachia endosymbiont of Litomosoides brasiliensis]